MDNQMKINADTVRRMRTERAWSQEQMADIAALSLRTIRRVEADGSASNETRMALAAAFGVDVRDLAIPGETMEELTSPARLAPMPCLTQSIPKQYWVAALLALVSIAALAAALVFKLDVIRQGMLDVIASIAVAATLYAAFGWYFSGRAPMATPARRTVQFGFIFVAMALAFTSLSGPPHGFGLVYMQMALFACAIRFAFDWFFSRKQPTPD